MTKKEKRDKRYKKRLEKNIRFINDVKDCMRNHDIDFRDAKFYLKCGTNYEGMTPCDMGGWCHCNGDC